MEYLVPLKLLYVLIFYKIVLELGRTVRSPRLLAQPRPDRAGEAPLDDVQGRRTLVPAGPLRDSRKMLRADLRRDAERRALAHRDHHGLDERAVGLHAQQQLQRAHRQIGTHRRGR